MKSIRHLAAGAIIFTLAACSTMQFQKLDQKVFYKRDLAIKVNGKKYDGVVVIPEAPKYEIELESPGNIDMILWKSCAREDSGSPKRPGFFIFKGEKTVKYTYEPLKGVEDTGTCPLRIDAYDAKNNQHAWAFLLFEHPDEFAVPFEFDCNGRRVPFSGVGACQHKAGLIARAQFFEAVMFATPKPEGCPMPKKVGQYLYKWEMGIKECLYHFKTKNGDYGKFTGIGYQGVLVRGGI